MVLSMVASDLALEVESHSVNSERKRFLFSEVEMEYEHSTMGKSDDIKFPLPLVGIEALQKTLHNLEFNKPLLFVDNVEISTIRTRRRVKRGTVSTGNLRVAMDISGFRRNGDLQ